MTKIGSGKMIKKKDMRKKDKKKEKKAKKVNRTRAVSMPNPATQLWGMQFLASGSFLQEGLERKIFIHPKITPEKKGECCHFFYILGLSW